MCYCEDRHTHTHSASPIRMSTLYMRLHRNVDGSIVLKRTVSEKAKFVPRTLSPLELQNLEKVDYSKPVVFAGKLYPAVVDGSDSTNYRWSSSDLSAINLRGKPLRWEHNDKFGDIGSITDHWLSKDDNWFWIQGEITDTKRFVDLYRQGLIDELSIGWSGVADDTTNKVSDKEVEEASMVLQGKYSGTKICSIRQGPLVIRQSASGGNSGGTSSESPLKDDVYVITLERTTKQVQNNINNTSSPVPTSSATTSEAPKSIQPQSISGFNRAVEEKPIISSPPSTPNLRESGSDIEKINTIMASATPPTVQSGTNVQQVQQQQQQQSSPGVQPTPKKDSDGDIAMKDRNTVIEKQLTDMQKQMMDFMTRFTPSQASPQSPPSPPQQQPSPPQSQQQQQQQDNSQVKFLQDLAKRLGIQKPETDEQALRTQIASVSDRIAKDQSDHQQKRIDELKSLLKVVHREDVDRLQHMLESAEKTYRDNPSHGELFIEQLQATVDQLNKMRSSNTTNNSAAAAAAAPPTRGVKRKSNIDGDDFYATTSTTAAVQHEPPKVPAEKASASSDPITSAPNTTEKGVFCDSFQSGTSKRSKHSDAAVSERASARTIPEARSIMLADLESKVGTRRMQEHASKQENDWSVVIERINKLWEEMPASVGQRQKSKLEVASKLFTNSAIVNPTGAPDTWFWPAVFAQEVAGIPLAASFTFDGTPTDQELLRHRSSTFTKLEQASKRNEFPTSFEMAKDYMQQHTL